MSDQITVLAGLLGVSPERIRCRPVAGGCISRAMRVDVLGSEDEGPYFAKVNDASFSDNFQAEAAGLRLLAETETIGVPQPLGVATAGGQAWMWSEWVEQASGGRDSGERFYIRFGQQLAEMHRASRGTRLGLDRDNYLGAARQLNGTTESWVAFVAQQRLGFQLKWGIQQGLLSGTLKRDVEQIINRLDQLLAGRGSETSLLHGDLWSGNYLCTAEGQPAIIDPAVYYGCREAEFGMLRLFGGCPPAFYEAYQSVWPLPEGWGERTQVYVLYHLLNHVNLFGSSYLGQTAAVAGQLLKR